MNTSRFEAGDRVRYVGDRAALQNVRGEVKEIKNPSFYGGANILVKWDHNGGGGYFAPDQLKKYRFRKSEQLGMEM